jgi:hypothetical protein
MENTSEFPPRTQVGEFTAAVVETLGLEIGAGTPIFVGESNIKHMEQAHPKDFKKYGKRLGRILSEPDYVGKRNDSVEFIKSFGMYVKIAVRVTTAGDFYARTLYHVDDNAAKRLIKDGEWKPLKIS